MTQVEYEPAVPSDVWEQAGPVGGADVDGRIPATAKPVLPVGVQTVRVLPTLNGNFGALTATSGGDAVRLVGRAPQRRQLVVLATSAGAAVVTLSDNAQQAKSGYGFRLPLNLPIPLPYAGELWVASATADALVSFASLVDQG